MQASPNHPAAGLEAVFNDIRDILVSRAASMGAGGDAEDVVQDVWLKLASTAGPIANPQAYLMRMVYTAVLDRQRGRLRGATRDTAWSYLGDPSNEGMINAEAERRLIAVETLDAVQKRLDDLGDPAAVLFRRHRIDGVPQKRLAQEHGMGLSTVEKHLRRAYAAIVDLEGRA